MRPCGGDRAEVRPGRRGCLGGGADVVDVGGAGVGYGHAGLQAGQIGGGGAKAQPGCAAFAVDVEVGSGDAGAGDETDVVPAVGDVGAEINLGCAVVGVETAGGAHGHRDAVATRAVEVYADRGGGLGGSQPESGDDGRRRGPERGGGGGVGGGGDVSQAKAAVDGAGHVLDGDVTAGRPAGSGRAGGDGVEGAGEVRRGGRAGRGDGDQGADQSAGKEERDSPSRTGTYRAGWGGVDHDSCLLRGGRIDR